MMVQPAYALPTSSTKAGGEILPLCRERLLIYHIGSLGDTMMAVPALWALRAVYPAAHRTLLTKRTSRLESVLAHSLFKGTDMFHDTLLYSGERYLDHRFGRYFTWLSLALRVRAGRFSTLAYLAPSERTPQQTARDYRFFRMCGILHLIGFKWSAPAKAQRSLLPPRSPLPILPQEAAFLLERLAGSGLPVPPLEQLRRDLDLNTEDEGALVTNWLNSQPPSGQRPWVAFAAGTNMPAKRWPESHFADVGKELISRADIWPLFFGGPEDCELGERLIAVWGRGANSAGALNPRAAAAAIRHCQLFIGNDTGTMHLAASEGVRCVAVFSARDFPGKWHPLGQGHVILRRSIPCAGCMLERCDRSDPPLCLGAITVKEVTEFALTLLEEGSAR